MSDPVFGNQKSGSIRDIPIPGKEAKEKPLDLKRKTQSSDSDLKDWDNMKGRNKRKGLKFVLGIIGLIVLFFVFSGLFQKATLTVWPKKDSAVIVQTFRATSSGEEGSLVFSRIAPSEGSRTIFIEGTDEQNVNTKSSGKIVVTNPTDSSQRFILNTRFETSDGLVYRTPRSVVIPANGSSEITVFADVPGEEYNSASGLTFKLPGLKGSDSYDLFTALQSTSFSGGFSGLIKSVSDSEADSVQVTLENELKSTLKDTLIAKVPAGFVVNDDLISYSDIIFTNKPNQEKGGVDLRVEGSIQAIAFKKTEFDSFVASAVLKEYTPGQSVQITNVPQIQMLITSKDFDVQGSDEFEFSLRSPESGAEFIWTIDESKLLQAVAGKKKSFIEKGFVPELAQTEKVNIEVSPFWKSSLPKNIKKIDIVVITE